MDEEKIQTSVLTLYVFVVYYNFLLVFVLHVKHWNIIFVIIYSLSCVN